MKVAVAIFRNGVSPRIDVTDSLMVYDIEDGIVKNQEKCALSFEQPADLVSVLQKKEIEKILCGGCPQFYLRTLAFYGVDVLRGLSGNPDHIIKSLIDGQLDDLPMINEPCKRHRRGRGQGYRGLDTWSDFGDANSRLHRRGKPGKKNLKEV